MSSKHYTTRQRRLQQSIGPSGMCPWAGRRGTEVVLGKVQDFLFIVSNASSNHFDHLLSHASHPHRSRVLAEFRLLTSSVCEELSSKLSFHRELPWKLLGGFGSHVGREDEAKACLVQCCSSFDRLWADPSKRKSLHRVAVHVLSPTSTIRPLVDMYAASTRDLTSFPELFCELRVLSLSVLVERTIESVHASVKAESRASHGILPGLVCAKIRARETLALLDNSKAFAFLCCKWRSRLAVHSLLAFANSKAVPAPLPTVYAQVYCYDLAKQFADHSLTGQCITKWEGLLRGAVAAASVPMSREYKFLVDYLKDICSPGVLLSLPQPIADLVLVPFASSDADGIVLHPLTEVALIAQLTHTIDAHAALPIPDGMFGFELALDQNGIHGGIASTFDQISCNASVFLMVTNAFPEHRILPQTLHSNVAKTLVSVAVVPGSHATFRAGHQSANK